MGRVFLLGTGMSPLGEIAINSSTIEEDSRSAIWVRSSSTRDGLKAADIRILHLGVIPILGKRKILFHKEYPF